MSEAIDPTPSAPQPLRLYGRAVPYGPWSQPVDGMRYRVTKGAYVPDEPTLAYYSHNKQTLIGTTENKSLRFNETDLGLHVEIDLPDTSEANKTFKLVDGDYITGMSFGMRIIEARKIGRSGSIDDYEVTKFTLTEVSPTPKPSFKGTWIATTPTPREGRDEIVRQAQAAIDADHRRRVATRQMQSARVGMYSRR